MQDYRDADQVSGDGSLFHQPKHGVFYKFAFLWVYRYFAAADKPALHASLQTLLPQTARYEADLEFSATDTRVDLRKTLWSHVSVDLCKVVGVVLFKKACDVMTVQLMYRMSVEIVEGRGDLELLQYTLPRIYALDLIGIISLAWAELLSTEIGQSSRNLANCLIYRKLLTFRLLYNNQHFTESQIASHLTSDTIALTYLYEIIKNYIEGVVNILLFLTWGMYHFGSPIIVMMAVYIALQVFSVYIVSWVNSNQQEYLAFKDTRLKYLKSLINGIHLVKLLGLERKYFYQLCQQRMLELDKLISLTVKRTWVSLFNWNSAYISLVCSFAYMFWLGNPLTYVMAVPLSKMLHLIFNTTGLIPKATENMMNLKLSLKRLQEFMDTESIEPVFPSKRLAATSHPLHLLNASFTWKPRPPPTSQELTLSPAPPVFAFRSVNLHVARKEFVAIVGPVGAGKSSLLAAIYNEMQSAGSAQKYLHEDSMFLGQRPWILNKSLRHNVVLSRPFDRVLFDRALDAACLRDDVGRMASGADTACGKRGEKLSGGQRWRVALARAYYQQRELLVVDDPVSALDNETADHVISELVSGSLRNRSRLVVTHRRELAMGADRVYYVEEGESPKEITKEQLGTYFQNIKSFFKSGETAPPLQLPSITGATTQSKVVKSDSSSLQSPMGLNRRDFLKSLGDMKSELLLPVIMVAMVTASALEPYSVNFMVKWGAAFQLQTQWTDLGLLGLLYLAKSMIPPVRRVVMFVHSQKHLSSAVHSRMLHAVVHSDIRTFHETVPSGLILNRMSNDLSKVDNKLCDSLGMTLNLFCLLLTIFATTVLAIHWISFLFLAVFALASVFIQRRVVSIRRTLTQNSNACLTPILDHVENSLQDLTALRSLRLDSTNLYCLHTLGCGVC